MKVHEIPYKRYTIEEGRTAFDAFKASCESAACADDVIRARETFLAEMKNYEEAASLSNCSASCSGLPSLVAISSSE